MQILITGASGLVGSKLVPLLTSRGHRVIKLVRRAPVGDGERRWNPTEALDPKTLSGIDAVIHLAGENIGEGRWTAAKKKRIRDSRVDGTRVLSEAIARANPRPLSLICASAIGFYGERGTELLDESHSVGAGFLPGICREWESAADPARAAGVRVVNLRLGVVLSPTAGALSKMLLPFKLFAGGNMGSGRQYWSCLSVDEAAQIFCFTVEHPTLSGPVNAVGPTAVTNAEFTKTLGRVLHRPTVFPLPAFIAKLALGEMAQDLILASTRVSPKRLVESGYEFLHKDLESGLRAVLTPAMR